MTRQISPELRIKADKDLNEDPERIRDDLKHLREWLKKQPHLNIRDEDQILLSFLRGCKYSLQTTKFKLDSYYTARTLLPEIYEKRDPILPEIQAILNGGFIFMLPEPLDNGEKIVLWNMSVCNADTMPFYMLDKVMSMFCDILINEDANAMVYGVHIWVELKNSDIKYVTQFTPATIKKHMHIVTNTLPLRLKGVYVTSSPSILEVGYHLANKFVSSKIMKRMHLQHDIEQLYSFIPQRLLPKEYGGSNGSIETLKCVWKNKIESYRDWFLEDSKYKTNESLRPGEPRTSSNVFGIEGSFRKLNVD